MITSEQPKIPIDTHNVLKVIETNGNEPQPQTTDTNANSCNIKSNSESGKRSLASEPDPTKAKMIHHQRNVAKSDSVEVTVKKVSKSLDKNLKSHSALAKATLNKLASTNIRTKISSVKALIFFSSLTTSGYF